MGICFCHNKLQNWINWWFGSFDMFQAQLKSAAKAVEASGWCILCYHPAFCRLELLQCEKHQNLTQWGVMPILVCDVWEHAYFLKYQSSLDQYVDAWWTLVKWEEVEQRLVGAYNGLLPLI